MAGVFISAFSMPAFTQCNDADTRKLEEFDRAWSEGQAEWRSERPPK
jgi:hypothetical protein